MNLDPALLQRAVPAGSMRYYAWLFTPITRRDAIAALFLLERELRESAHATHEVAHIRLQWWRDEVERLLVGQAQHPATRVLQATAMQMDFPILHNVVLSAAQELANASYETEQELTAYLSNGLGNLCALAAQCLCESATADVRSKEIARQLGMFIRQTEVLRDLRQDVHHGRLFLPLHELDKLHVDAASLQAEAWPARFTQWLAQRSRVLLTEYRVLQQGLTVEQRCLRPLRVLAELHGQVLNIIAGDPGLHTRQPVELPPFKKLWTAWRAARRA